MENCKCKTTDKEFLYVISVVSNPARFKRRYQLFNEFVERMKQNKLVKLYTTELQIGNRPFATNATFKLRSDHNLWHKENLINYTLRRLPKEANYIAWIDADIEFQNPRWAEETIEKLQEYNVVQPWSSCIDMGPKSEIMKIYTCFCKVYHDNNRVYYPKGFGGYEYAHPGYAFAYRRETLDGLGGVIDFAIAGSGDHHMACALVGVVTQSCHGEIHDSYRQALLNYQNLCNRFVQKKIGYVEGIILHNFHGKKQDRQYVSRWDILLKHHFNLNTDISYDINGIIKFNGNKPSLEMDLRNYSYSRNEDSIDMGDVEKD